MCPRDFDVVFSAVHRGNSNSSQDFSLGNKPGTEKKRKSHSRLLPPFPLVQTPTPPPRPIREGCERRGGGVMSLTMCVYVAIAADHQHIFSSHMVPSLSSGFKRWIKREHPVFSVCFFFFFYLGEGGAVLFSSTWWMRGLTRWWVSPKPVLLHWDARTSQAWGEAARLARSLRFLAE